MDFIRTEDQHADLLPARTVMTTFLLGGAGGNGGDGGDGGLAVALNVLNIEEGNGDQHNVAFADASGGNGGDGGNGGNAEYFDIDKFYA